MNIRATPVKILLAHNNINRDNLRSARTSGREHEKRTPATTGREAWLTPTSDSIANTHHHHHHHHHHPQSLNPEGCWGTTDNFATSFLHFSLFSTALWDLPNSRPVHFLMLFHLFLCLPCLLPSFTVPWKMVLTRPDERETWPYHCSLVLFTMVRRSSCGPIACWILSRTFSLVTGLCMRCVVSCGTTSFPWLVFFFRALLWGSIIHKHTGRRIWQGSASMVSWNWEKYSWKQKWRNWWNTARQNRNSAWRQHQKRTEG